MHSSFVLGPLVALVLGMSKVPAAAGQGSLRCTLLFGVFSCYIFAGHSRGASRCRAESLDADVLAGSFACQREQRSRFAPVLDTKAVPSGSVCLCLDSSSAPLLAGAASVLGTKMVPNCCMAEPLEAGLFSHVHLCAGLFSPCSTRKWRQPRRVAEPVSVDSLLRSFPLRICAGHGNLAGGRGAALLGAGFPALCLAASSAHPAGTCCGLRQGGASGRGPAPPLLSESPAVGLAASAPPTGGGELVPAAVGRPSPDDDINTMPFTTVLSAQIAQW